MTKQLPDNMDLIHVFFPACFMWIQTELIKIKRMCVEQVLCSDTSCNQPTWSKGSTTDRLCIPSHQLCTSVEGRMSCPRHRTVFLLFNIQCLFCHLGVHDCYPGLQTLKSLQNLYSLFQNFGHVFRSVVRKWRNGGALTDIGHCN
jgi:hypothetical protein